MKRVLFLLMAIVFAFSVQAEEVFRLETVKTFLDKKKESVRLEFDKHYREIPSMTSEPGLVRIMLPQAVFPEKLSHQRINDGFIQNIRLFQQKKSVLVEIEFANRSFNIANLLDYDFKERRMEIRIKKPEVIKKPEKVPEKDLGKAEELDLPEADQMMTAEPLEEGWTYTLVKMLIALLLILGIFYLVLWLYNRYFSGKFNLRSSPYEIKVASTHHLGPKQKVVVLEVNGHAYACGVSQSQISLLAPLENQMNDQFNDLLKQDGMTIGQLRAEFQKSIEEQQVQPETNPENQSTNASPALPSFQDELLQKVKKMRQID